MRRSPASTPGGSQVLSLLQRREEEEAVSIPSSSDLRLESRRRRNSPKKERLNPFFIRSAVGTSVSVESTQSNKSQSLLHQVCGWNRGPEDHEDREGGSQSLLHQVCGWNVAGIESTAHSLRLNPFFIRSAVGILQRAQEELRGTVSIPSSSGLRLECPRMGEGDAASMSQSLLHQVCGWNFQDRGNVGGWGLNPFFIRSAVGISPGRCSRRRGPSQSLLHQVCGWNFPRRSRRWRSECLNPFFIRSAVGMSHRVTTTSHRCLNPFFIRSAVGIVKGKVVDGYYRSQSLLHQVCGWNSSPTGDSTMLQVSIPSSSGLRLE